MQNKKLNVLYLTKVFPYPPATAGDAVYSRGIIECLSKDVSLTVICATNNSTKEPARSAKWCITDQQKTGRFGSLFSSLPLIAWKNSTKGFKSELKNQLNNSWDAIILDNIGLVHALRTIIQYREKNKNLKLYYISHEYEYQTRRSKYDSYGLSYLKRLLASFDLAKVKRAEESLLRFSDIVTVINVADINFFKTIAPAKKYLPFSPGYDGNVVSKREIDIDTPRKILLLGGRKSEQKKQILIDWMKVSYQKILQEGIEVVVVGDMDDDLKKIMEKNYSEVKVCGFIEDLTSLIQSARMGLIVDTVGGGFKMRLLSHVFERLPIVGLSDAISGLATKEGEGYLGAADLPQLLEVILKNIDNIKLLNSLQNKAYVDCISEYSWQSRSDVFIKSLIAKSNRDLF